MTQKPSLDDLLVKYVYGECTPEEIEKVRNAVLTDYQTAEQLVQLFGSKEALDKISYQPSEETIANILEYSKGLSKEFYSN